MAILPVKKLDNSPAGEVEISDAVAQAEVKPHLVHEVVVAHLKAKRQGTRAVKDKSVISGSTRKLWKQKGTGRARVGSIKSPIWRHGAVVFGPAPRDFSVKVNRKVKRSAMLGAMADMIREGRLVVVDSLDLPTHKTKDFRKLLAGLGCESCLIVVGDEAQENLVRASGNLPNVELVSHSSLNVYSLIRYEKAVFLKDALKTFEERLVS